MERQIGQATTVVETAPDQVISEGIVTTGEISGYPPEQAIPIEVDRGIVVMTGCAHPGIVAIIEHVKQTSEQPIYVVLGGFHLGNLTRNGIDGIPPPGGGTCRPLLLYA